MNVIRLLHSITTIAVIASSHAEDTQHHFIVGGEEVENGRYSYAVALTGYDLFFCTGVLIAPGYVVSAAHCGGLSSNLGVHIGRHDFQNYSEYFSGNYEKIEVEYEVIHPDFDDCDNNNVINDVMVLKLANNSSYAPVNYNTDPDESKFVGELATVIGFGKKKDNNNCNGGELMETEVEIKSNVECDDMTPRKFQPEESHICGYKKGGGACDGDSGGPLIIKGETADSDLLIGISSYRFGKCGNSLFADVNSRTSSFVDFFTCVTKGGSDECGDVLYTGEKKSFFPRGDWHVEKKKLFRMILEKLFRP